MRIYPVEENPIGSAVSEIIRTDSQTHKQTFCYFSIRIIILYSEITLYNQLDMIKKNTQKLQILVHLKNVRKEMSDSFFKNLNLHPVF